MTIIRLASDHKLVGNTRQIGNVSVLWVAQGERADIRFQRYTKDYARYSDRPYKVGARSFKTLEAAVKALAT
jgi:hypothetical protein